MANSDYGIATGWNGTPTGIESITVPSTPTLNQIEGSGTRLVTHYIVKTVGKYDVPEMITPSAATQNGLAIKPWMFSLITLEAYAHLRSTFAGNCTVTTTLDESTFVTKNAILRVPYRNDFALRATYNGSSVYVLRECEIFFAIVSDTA